MSSAPAPVSAPIPLPVGRLVGVGAIIFFANAALLVLQLVAGRLLSPYIGSSLETWTSIIGVFLAGIALGNAFGGRLADRYPTPKTLAILLGVGAVAALWMLLFPQLLASNGFYKSIPLGPRIPVLAAILCLPAGFVLSLLTPLAIKLGLPDVAHTGRVAGLIFALSTLGCLVGNYVTGFYLIPTFTVNALVLFSAGALGVLAVVALVVVKPSQSTPDAATNGGRTEATDASAGRNPHAFSDIRQAYLIVFLASFCGMTLELTASRVLAQYLGVSLFTWTGIIGVMLAGTALGNFTGGQFADRPKNTLAWLAGAVTFLSTIAVAGVVALVTAYDPEQPVVEHVLGIPAQNWAKYAPLSYEAFEERGDEIRVFIRGEVPELLPRLRTQLLTGVGIGVVLGALLGYFVFGLLKRSSAPAPNPRSGLAATLCAGGAATVFLFVTMALISRYHLFELWDPVVQVLVWTFSMFFLPMFALGMVSPQVIRLAVPDVSQAGAVAGRVYAWSTVGAIVGTFAAGYVLLSVAGMNRTLLAASFVVTVTSLIVAKVWNNNSLLYLFSIVLGGIVGGFILTARTSRDTGIMVESNYYTIKVTRESPFNTRLKLTLDHLVHSSVDPYDPGYLYYHHEHTQMEFLRLARTQTAEPKALVIGGGGYTFPRYALEMMPEAHVDVVEIDPKVTQVARDHLGLRDYPGLQAIHMDGRQFVSEKAAPGSYDLVIQDAVNDLSVPAHLMTKEYNDAVKVSLKPGGAYLLTIIDSIAYGKLWKAAMATLTKTFPAENIVLLTAERPAPAGTAAGDSWDQTRRVLVIYASDKPFDLDKLHGAVADQLSPGFAAGLAVGAAGGADLRAALPITVSATPLAREGVRIYTAEVPAARLKPYTDREPGVILTDQFCPIDNLMAEVFRQRYK